MGNLHRWSMLVHKMLLRMCLLNCGVVHDEQPKPTTGDGKPDRRLLFRVVELFDIDINYHTVGLTNFAIHFRDSETLLSIN